MKVTVNKELETVTISYDLGVLSVDELCELVELVKFFYTLDNFTYGVERNGKSSVVSMICIMQITSDDVSENDWKNILDNNTPDISDDFFKMLEREGTNLQEKIVKYVEESN